MRGRGAGRSRERAMRNSPPGGRARRGAVATRTSVDGIRPGPQRRYGRWSWGFRRVAGWGGGVRCGEVVRNPARERQGRGRAESWAWGSGRWFGRGWCRCPHRSPILAPAPGECAGSVGGVLRRRPGGGGGAALPGWGCVVFRCRRGRGSARRRGGGSVGRSAGHSVEVGGSGGSSRSAAAARVGFAVWFGGSGGAAGWGSVRRLRRCNGRLRPLRATAVRRAGGRPGPLADRCVARLAAARVARWSVVPGP